MSREKRSLLVVDSSASFVFYMTMLLKKLDYTVRTATTAEDALHIITDSAPALVITDTVLPHMSGVDLLKKIKKSAGLRFIPVIMHTASIDPAVKETCTLAGCAGYFIKPVEADALYRAIQAATEATPRKNIRIETSLKVQIGDGFAPGGTIRMEEVTTISEGGLYIKTLVPEPVNTVLSLTLFLRNRQIRAKAVVLYSSAKEGGQHKVPGMGMKFAGISPDDRDLIREFIKEQITKDLALGNRPASQSGAGNNLRT